MNVSLTKELENYVQDKLKSGLYTSASEVIREGLRLLQEQEQLRAVKLKALKSEIKKGLNDAKSGRTSSLDIDSVKARGRKIINKKNSP
ncbi:MAG: type II toxin-antitoxin system ParD family antitoxin [Sedimentisphaerales bacterium]|nr:type II toxin-antitoxin system ParD family antitoxin [Sedimentisphaerales bacterium]